MFCWIQCFAWFYRHLSVSFSLFMVSEKRAADEEDLWGSASPSHYALEILMLNALQRAFYLYAAEGHLFLLCLVYHFLLFIGSGNAHSPLYLNFFGLVVNYSILGYMLLPWLGRITITFLKFFCDITDFLMETWVDRAGWKANPIYCRMYHSVFK